MRHTRLTLDLRTGAQHIFTLLCKGLFLCLDKYGPHNSCQFCTEQNIARAHCEKALYVHVCTSLPYANLNNDEVLYQRSKIATLCRLHLELNFQAMPIQSVFICVLAFCGYSRTKQNSDMCTHTSSSQIWVDILMVELRIQCWLKQYHLTLPDSYQNILAFCLCFFPGEN